MKKAIRYGIALASLSLIASGAFTEVKLTFTSPSVHFATESYAAGSPELLVAEQLNTAFDVVSSPTGVFNTAIGDLEDQIGDKLNKFGEQKKLAEGFGNATSYSGQAATMQGYQGYKLFAVMGGGMLGIQIPSTDIAQLKTIPDTIMDDPDLYAGFAASMPVFSIGINAETVFGLIGLGDLFNNLYINLKAGGGSFNYETELDVNKLALNFESFNVGLGVNYQLFPSIGVLGGLARWRGINLGSGFTVQNSAFDVTLTLDKITQNMDPMNFSIGPSTVTANGALSVIPAVKLGSNVTTFTIPLEASTSVQFLWLFNLNVGVGADFVFGTSDVIAEASTPIIFDLTIDDPSNTITSPTNTPGSIKLDAGTKGVSPAMMHARLMTGLGTNFGPLKIDMPVYYYLSSGFAVGLTVGIVW